MTSISRQRKSKAVVAQEHEDSDHVSTDDSTNVATPPRIARRKTLDGEENTKSPRSSQKKGQSSISMNDVDKTQDKSKNEDPATEKNRVHKRILFIVLLTHCVLTLGHYLSQRYFQTGTLSAFEQTLVSTMENATEEMELAAISRANAVTLNYVQDWYNQLNESLLPGRSLISDKISEDGSSCLETLFADLRANFPLTDPDSMDTILREMGLAKYPDLVNPIAQAGLLKESQNTSEIFESSFMCLKESRAIEKLACQTLKYFPDGLIGNSTDEEDNSSIKRSLDKAIVVDLLTEHATEEYVTLKSVLGIIREHDNHMLSHYEQVHKDNTLLREYNIKQHKRISARLTKYLKGVSQGSQTMEKSGSLFKLTIMEAVKIDLERGMEANARVGVALAAAINFAGTEIEPFFDSHKMTWLLGSNWIEAYVAWYLAFSTASQSFSALPLTLAPALACRIKSENGGKFMAAEMIANGLSLTSVSLGIDSESMNSEHSRMLDESSSWEEFLMSLGQANLESLDLPVLSTDEVSIMFSELIDEYGSDFLDAHAGTSAAPILKSFNIEEYITFLGFVVFVTKMIAGIGAELRSLWNFPQKLQEWEDNHASNYKIKSLVQPLMSSATLYLSASRNGLSILTTVVSLWKDGLPESIAFVYAALFHPEKDRSTFACRFADFLSGVGIVLQNGGVSMLASMLLTGVIEPTREILDPATILVIQHWTLPLQYLNIWVFGLFAIVAEIWFEWSVFGNENELLKDHWTAASGYLVIMVAHWFFLISAALNIRATGSPLGAELANVASHLAVKVNLKDMESTIRKFEAEKDDDNDEGRKAEIGGGNDEEQIDFVDQIERLFLQEEGRACGEVDPTMDETEMNATSTSIRNIEEGHTIREYTQEEDDGIDDNDLSEKL